MSDNTEQSRSQAASLLGRSRSPAKLAALAENRKRAVWTETRRIRQRETWERKRKEKEVGPLSKCPCSEGEEHLPL